MRTTLFVAGFGARTRARDLAYEFERYLFSRTSEKKTSEVFDIREK